VRKTKKKKKYCRGLTASSMVMYVEWQTGVCGAWMNEREREREREGDRRRVADSSSDSDRDTLISNSTIAFPCAEGVESNESLITLPTRAESHEPLFWCSLSESLHSMLPYVAIFTSVSTFCVPPLFYCVYILLIFLFFFSFHLLVVERWCQKRNKKIKRKKENS